ncbi:ArsR/SmtB family transcription factor [Halorarum halobium]|uniref:ArsR/SmtB family transcription factor n=1 Tax=Halorarum halobium TaxID=3075121 RepID=UPI0028A84EBB|nr:helix-turn-helix domain-containing protein [Halobaculum sp. XH14]
MTSLLPLKPATENLAGRDLDPRLVDFADADADDVLAAVSSTTARRILGSLYEEPRTASDVAAALDTSVQNASYHLDRLVDADLVEVVETWYSGQGREMDVYAPTNSALVIHAGAEHATPSLSTALRRALGALGVLGLASALVHARWTGRPSVRPVRTPLQQPPEPTLWDALAGFATGPGGVLLWVGLVVTCCLFGLWYWRTYRPRRRRHGSA